MTCIVEGLNNGGDNKRMCKHWDIVKSKLDKNTSISLNTHIGIVFLHKKDKRLPIVLRNYYNPLNFDFEYIRRKLKTKKYNKFIHKPKIL